MLITKRAPLGARQPGRIRRDRLDLRMWRSAFELTWARIGSYVWSKELHRRGAELDRLIEHRDELISMLVRTKTLPREDHPNGIGWEITITPRSSFVVQPLAWRTSGRRLLPAMKLIWDEDSGEDTWRLNHPGVVTETLVHGSTTWRLRAEDRPHLPLLHELFQEAKRTMLRIGQYTDYSRPDWIEHALDGETVEDTALRVLLEKGVRPGRLDKTVGRKTPERRANRRVEDLKHGRDQLVAELQQPGSWVPGAKQRQEEMIKVLNAKIDLLPRRDSRGNP